MESYSPEFGRKWDQDNNINAAGGFLQAMTDRKQNRPRIDAIMRGITNGDYDDVLQELQTCLNNRNSVKRKAILQMVQEVYGDDAVITTKRALPSMGTSAGVSLRSAQTPGASLDDDVPTPDALGEDPVLPSEADGAPVDASTVQMPPEGPDANGYESRSPVIGPLNPS